MDISTSWIKFVIVWGILGYIIALKFNTPSEVEYVKTFNRINATFKQLQKSSQKNLEILNFIENYISNLYKKQENSLETKFLEIMKHQFEQFENVLKYKKNINTGIQQCPSLDYEQQRRQIRQNNQEMWNYFNGEFKKIILNLTSNEFTNQINNLLKFSAEHKRSLISDIDQMRSFDGYEIWRQQESEDLSNLVQKRLEFMQNRKACKSVKKLLCNINLECGFGCQLHHVADCFITAYSTERTMILKSDRWRYHKDGFQEIFEEVCDKCTEYTAEKDFSWPASLLAFSQLLSLFPEPHKVLAVPKDLASRLKILHGDPTVWWISQFFKYLLRPKPETQKILETNMERVGWKKPIVGVHIRRSDKIGTEASFHNVEEYMIYVEDYYQTLEIHNRNVERRIFLATDEPFVITEIRSKYPRYIVLCDTDAAKIANIATRYTNTSINGIISDIHMLSLSDYLVCTFSSQLCRLAYEIMQTYHPDASDRCQSLDDIYYFSGQNDHNLEVIISHNPRNQDEIYMKSGDIIHVAGNLWNGFSTGKNRRTYNIGSFPSFKVKNVFETVQLPIQIYE